MANNNGNNGLLVGLTLLGAGIVGGIVVDKFVLQKSMSSSTTQVPPPYSSVPTSTSQVLTTINWSVSPTTLPASGGVLDFTLTALDQSNNPIANYMGITLIESSVGTVGTFPATNSLGQAGLQVTIPPNNSSTPEALVFTLGGV